MKILYITNLTNYNIYELTLRPHGHIYYYGLIKLCGRKNVKLINISNIISNINIIEEFDYILISRDILYTIYIRKVI